MLDLPRCFEVGANANDALRCGLRRRDRCGATKNNFMNAIGGMRRALRPII